MEYSASIFCSVTIQKKPSPIAMCLLAARSLDDKSSQQSSTMANRQVSPVHMMTDFYVHYLMTVGSIGTFSLKRKASKRTDL
jgi:hypothetical protein